MITLHFVYICLLQAKQIKVMACVCHQRPHFLRQQFKSNFLYVRKQLLKKNFKWFLNPGQRNWTYIRNICLLLCNYIYKTMLWHTVVNVNLHFQESSSKIVISKCREFCLHFAVQKLIIKCQTNQSTVYIDLYEKKTEKNLNVIELQKDLT